LVKALGLVRDLFFRSKIDAVAQASGAEVVYASTLDGAVAQCAEGAPTIIFADLSDATFPVQETVARMGGAAPNARLIGFASHVDLKALRLARAAGFGVVLSREEFTSRLAELLSGRADV
jgi:DNA-binding NarL/FixJ family response regulator